MHFSVAVHAKSSSLGIVSLKDATLPKDVDVLPQIGVSGFLWSVTVAPGILVNSNIMHSVHTDHQLSRRTETCCSVFIKYTHNRF